MQLLHPFMPFVTEDVYHLLKQRQDDLTVKQFVTTPAPDMKILASGAYLKETITALRDVRAKNNIKPKDPIDISIENKDAGLFEEVESILKKQINIGSINPILKAATGDSKHTGQSIKLTIGKAKIEVHTNQVIDTTSQKVELEKDLEYLRGFLASVEKKLGNERFVQNAKPEVIEIEKKKKADAEEKIKVIEESLAGLN